MKLTFLGHAGFLLEGSKSIVIDPFLTGNPVAKTKVEDIKADLVLVSHGHGGTWVILLRLPSIRRHCGVGS